VKFVDKRRKERRSFSNSWRSLNGKEVNRRMKGTLQSRMQEDAHWHEACWKLFLAVRWSRGVCDRRSTQRSSTAQRVAFLTAEALGSFDSIAVHRRNSAALQALCVGSQRRRRISDRSVMTSVRNRKRESRLLVLLISCVYEATHAAFDLGRGQQQSRLIYARGVLTAAICLPQP
jgi:hypothetical protein